MKKTFSLILLTLLTLGLFRPITALAEEQKLPSGIERNQIGQKIEDYVKEHEKTTAAMETAVFDKETLVIWIKKKASKLTTAASLIGAL